MQINKGQIYNLIQAITPPLIFSTVKKSRIYPKIKKAASKFLKNDSLTPSWNVIKGGLLGGKKLYLDPKGIWNSMLTGSYDDFFIDYLSKLDLKDKVIYDIGAHFGYSSLCFATLVGANGKVCAFEPNKFNKERFEYILTENDGLAKTIKIVDVAVSDKEGEEDFIFNSNVDNGTSSGSFLDNSHTFFEKEAYEKEMGFEKVKVRTVALDNIEKIGILDKPDLMKIDIEGAEYLALEGGRQVLKNYKPILLIEIHSIFNMYKVNEILKDFDYQIELLKEEKDGRCFIAAK